MHTFLKNCDKGVPPITLGFPRSTSMACWDDDGGLGTTTLLCITSWRARTADRQAYDLNGSPPTQPIKCRLHESASAVKEPKLYGP